jgi:hypothetical protein
MKLLNGTGYTMHQGPDGFYLDIDFPDPIVTLHPFYVTLFKVAGANKFKVEAGTVNSKVPTLDGTKLDVLPAPSKTVSATGSVYLKCQYSSSGAFPYTVTVEFGSTIPADDEEFAYVAIATINITSGVATKTAQVVTTSLNGDRLKCGTNPASYAFGRT